MNKESKFVSTVIYFHNEYTYLDSYIKIVHKFLREHFLKYEIICVDDASTDNSVEKITKLVQQDGLENITLVSMNVYQGRERGMEAGVDLSIGDYVFELEWVDLTNKDTYENMLWEAYTKAVQGYDIVTYASEEHKSLGSAIFYDLYNKSNLNLVGLTPERFRVVTRRAINRVSRMNKTIVYRKALYANSGLRSFVIGTNKHEVGKNIKKEIKNKRKTGFNVFLAYTGLVPKIAMILEFILIFLCIAAVGYIVISKNTTIGICVLIMLLVGALLGIMIVFVIKYVELLLELVLKKERYIVSSVEKLSNSERKE